MNLAIKSKDNNQEIILALKNSVYPGAKNESIAMAINYCKNAKLDPLQKPVHIVPMPIRNSQGTIVWQDVIMPGIGLYRTQASRSGAYAGMTEPQFGEEITEDLGGITITYPKWCVITVRKLIDGQMAEFIAREYWKENYATAKKDTTAPNKMWHKRPYGQLAKCTEAQALRKAFPELTGALPTYEEMEGKIEMLTEYKEAQHTPNGITRLKQVLNIVPDSEKEEIKNGSQHLNQIISTKDKSNDIQIFPFGKKYKDQPINEIPEDYLKWVLQEDKVAPDIKCLAQNELTRRKQMVN